ncbi:MAG: PVC-type heme-binding CxxCH protein [Verrucomicrobiia bacterium]|jgi:putative membrane-bound dehydrogenase-like protein
MKARYPFRLILVSLSLLFALSLGAADAKKTRILFMIGENEYRTDESLPKFAKEQLEPLGFESIFVHASKDDPNHFPGLEQLKDANVLFLSVRRRTLSGEQMEMIKAHFKAGKAVIAIRTSSHAFGLRKGEPPAGHVEWKEFDKEVLGHDYENHFGNKSGTDIATIPHSIRDPLMTGVKITSFHSSSTLYKARNLAGNSRVLLRGVTMDKGEPQLEPVALYRTYGKSKVFYTSLGHIDDFKHVPFNRMLVNAVYWAAHRPIPGSGAQASLQHSKERDKFDMSIAGNEKVAEIIKTFAGRGEIGDHSTPTAPDAAVKLFQVHSDFEMELVAHEPTIKQPLFMTFDHRGRMWVVQYLQYPFPAGLKVIKYDQYLRAVFDKVPPPPPNHFKGADKITVLEDTNGDGNYDKAKDVITGLNIVSSLAIGRGGIWVLNPPYLMFYPDADGDDIPDGDPEVHLRGFGLEDTHSVANSLMWAPDGWLYGANGSTTTATIDSEVTKGVHFKGQNIWRYHPESKVFEIYAEGGGNTWSTEVDGEGRVFSGTNHGRTHGMHYAQGGYASKNWGKHGPLTNPYAFGFFEHMKHEGFPERFSQTFCIYEGGAFPEKYHHAVVAGNSLHNRVVASKLIPDTSTFRTKDYPPLVLAKDRWFRPVDIKVGPDGAVYVADWYDSRLTHVDPRDNWHKSSGRIYRLKAKGAKPLKPFDLSKQSNAELVKVLTTHKNKWFRHEAVRVLGDRKDKSIIPQLRRIVMADDSPRALDALWALNLSGGFDNEVALRALESENPHMRRWAVRLVGDAKKTTPKVAAELKDLAVREPEVEVRSQLASSAKRLPADQGLPIVRELAARGSDVNDLHIPLLLWWAVEAKCGNDRDAVLTMFKDANVWELPMVEEHLLERLMRRYAMAGSPQDLQTCADLLALSPSKEHSAKLMAGLMQAFQGRQIGSLPSALAKALDEHQSGLGKSGVVIGLRRGDQDALKTALSTVGSSKADMATRLAYIQILGEINQPKAISTLARLLRTTGATSINLAALKALQNYSDASIGKSILGAYHSALLEEHGVRATANRVLASRKEWALQFLGEIDQWRIKSDKVAIDVVQQMALHKDEKINALIEKHWGKLGRATPEEKIRQMARIEKLIKANRGKGDLKKGKELFTVACANCHTLFEEGAKLGPELTGYERDNLDFLLLAIVDPSAAIREEFTSFTIETKDNRQLVGLIENQDTRTVTMRGLDNQPVLIPRDKIKKLQASHISLMPEGLTEALPDEMIVDLFAYIMTRTPPKQSAKAR